MKSSSRLVRFSVAVLIAGAALLFRSALDPVIGNAARYTLFLLGVMLSAWFGGFFPGLATSAILILGGGYFHTRPPVFVPLWLAQLIPPVSFAVTSITCCILVRALRSAEDKAGRNEKSAREAEARLRSVVENTQEAIFSIDRDFRFTFVNQRTLEIAHKTRGQMIGRVIWELFPEPVDPAAYPELLRAMRDRVSLSFEASYAP